MWRTDQDDDNVAAALCPHLVNPARCVQERLSIWRAPAHSRLHTPSKQAQQVTSGMLLGKRAHLTRRTRPPRQTSPGYSSVSSCEIAPGLQCPCAALALRKVSSLKRKTVVVSSLAWSASAAWSHHQAHVLQQAGHNPGLRCLSSVWTRPGCDAPAVWAASLS